MEELSVPDSSDLPRLSFYVSYKYSYVNTSTYIVNIYLWYTRSFVPDCGLPAIYAQAKGELKLPCEWCDYWKHMQCW